MTRKAFVVRGFLGIGGVRALLSSGNSGFPQRDLPGRRANGPSLADPKGARNDNALFTRLRRWCPMRFSLPEGPADYSVATGQVPGLTVSQVWEGDQEAVRSGLAALLAQLAKGPDDNDDDDVFVRWPAGARLALAVADQVGTRAEVERAGKGHLGPTASGATGSPWSSSWPMRPRRRTTRGL